MVYVTLYVLTLVKKFKKMLQQCLKIFKNCLHLSYRDSFQNIILVPFLKRTHFSTFFSISSTHCDLLAIFFLRQKVNLKTLETFKNLILELFKYRQLHLFSVRHQFSSTHALVIFHQFRVLTRNDDDDVD